MAAAMIIFDIPMAAAIFSGFFLIVAVTRYVSLASMFVSVCFPLWVAFVMKADMHMVLVTCVFPVLVIFMHRSNIVRLINGTENKLGSKKK